MGQVPSIFSINCYVIDKNGSCIVIDPSSGVEKVSEYIEFNGFNLVAVFLTHGHFDHCGGAQKLADQYGCKIYANPKDEPWTSTAHENNWNYPAESCVIDKFFHDGALQIEDFEFQIIETPGHSEGSVCIVWENNLFTGDTLFCNSIGRTDFFDGSDEKICQSLKKLAKLETDYVVYPGHGESTTLAKEKKLNPFLIKYVN